MHRNYLAFAAVFGATGVMLGAFGAHGLQRLTSDETILHGYQTGVQYQLYHSLVLLVLAFLPENLRGKWIRQAFVFFCAGILLFSGSLYLITWMKVEQSNAVKYAGPVTPLGGLLLILGWLFLLVAAFTDRK